MINPLFAEVAEQMPPLAFNPDVDCPWVKETDPQAYLDYYHINFPRDYPGLQHGFGYLPAAGFKVATHYWLPENPRGTLVVVHGYYDHVGLYGNAIRFGLDQGYAVLAFDLPGHGLSSGEQASIESFGHYADALRDVLDASERLLPQPCHCLAQSTGGAAVLNYLWRHGGEKLDRVVLCAPLILPIAWRSSRLIYWLVRPFVKRVRRVFIDSSHDETFNHFLRHQDGLQHAYLPVAWVTAMRKWNEDFCGYPRLNKPLLLIQGNGDKTVDWRYNLMQVRRKMPVAKTRMIEGARHHLVNESEPYRSQVFAAAAEWFGQASAGKKR